MLFYDAKSFFANSDRCGEFRQWAADSKTRMFVAMAFEMMASRPASGRETAAETALINQGWQEQRELFPAMLLNLDKLGQENVDSAEVSPTKSLGRYMEDQGYYKKKE